MNRVALAAILIVSFALRLLLAYKGGQDFWPDEARYGAAGTAVHAFVRGDAAGVARELIGHPDHTLFRAVALPPAILEYIFGGRPAMVGAYFGLFSTLAILLIWAVARRAGAGEAEALWAAFFAAAANSLFFYSRHYLPYDAALCWMLFGLWLSFGPPSHRRSFVAGAAVGAGFLTYNGYWLLGGAVLILHTLFGPGRGGRECFRRGMLAGLGLLAPLGLWLATAHTLGFEPLRGMRSFAGTVVQGDFGLGLRVIAEYLWYSERGTLLVWLAAAGAGIALSFRAREWPLRLIVWLGAIVILAGGLVALSDILSKFVVYGRLVRMLVPFLCLAAGYGVVRVLGAWPITRRRSAPAAVALLVLVSAAVNVAAPLRQVFVPDFRRLVAERIQNDTTESGLPLRVVHVEDLWWGLPKPVELPAHRELLRKPHPFQFRPYQYEGFTARDRGVLDSYDIAMRLVRMTDPALDPAPAWEEYPGPLRLRVKFPAGPIGEAQPLVTTGRMSKGDMFYVRVIAPGVVRFGLDHWGSAGFETEEVKFDLEQAQEVTISLGSLMPPSDAALFRRHHGLVHLRNYATVTVGDEIVYNGRADFHPSEPSNIVVGGNLIGGSVVSSFFKGEIERVATAPPSEWVARLPQADLDVLKEQRGPEWLGTAGPVRIVFTYSALARRQPQPLLSIGEPGTGEVLFMIADQSDGIYLGYSREGQEAVLSQRLVVDPNAEQRIEIFAAKLMPGANAPVYRDYPALWRVAELIHVRLNGRPAFHVTGAAPSERADLPRAIVGANTAANPICSAYFAGTIREVELIGPGEMNPEELTLAHVVGGPDPSWHGYTGPLRMKILLPSGLAGASEPLLVTGTAGAANFLYVQYVDSRHIRIGFDSWGHGGPVSEPVLVEPGQPQELVVSLGALVPPAEGSRGDLGEDVGNLRSLVFVTVNGTTVLNERVTTHPSRPEHVSIGWNGAGGSSTGKAFSGRVLSILPVSPPEIVARSRTATRFERSGWSGYPGPVRLRVTFPQLEARQTQLGEPLLVTGVEGAGDFVAVWYADDGTARIGIDHWGAPVTWSESLTLEPGSEYVLVVSHAGLFPPEGTAIGESDEAWLRLRQRTIVELDGRRLIDVPRAAHPSPPGRILYGRNSIGGSTTGPAFRGRILAIEHANLAALSAPESGQGE